ncbi:MAG: hypothetical protein IKA32_12580, partial [Lentisphaeria bacterium]|nr:hypothetical protein [Lentisphaeria bacterium]
ANPRGITWRTHHYLIGLIGLISLMQAPRPRRPHTTVAIKKPANPTGTFIARAIQHSTPQTLQTVICLKIFHNDVEKSLLLC